LVREAARFLGPGHLARETLSTIENGRRNPGSALLEALAQALDTSIDYLVGLTDDPGIAIPAMPVPELELVDLVARLNALDPVARVRVAELFGGVADCHPHRFRHTFAIEYLRNGGNVLALQASLGHSSLEMVRVYARVAQADLENGHRVASPVDNWRL